MQFIMKEAAKKMSELENMSEEKAQQSIVEHLLKSDMDVDTISKYNGIVKEKIREIKQNMK